MTLKQLAMLMSLNPTPPWRASSLASAFPTKPLLLRSAIVQTEARTAYLSVQARDASILREASSPPAQFWAAWNQAQPSKETLDQLAGLVQIKYLSPDWRQVIIAGTTGSLVNIPGVRVLSIQSGLVDIGVGAGIALSGGVETAGVLVAVGAGVAGVGVEELEEGIFDAIFPAGTSPSESYYAEGTITLPEITIYGDLPSSVTPDNVLDLGTIEISDIPDTPPDGGDGGDGGGP